MNRCLVVLGPNPAWQKVLQFPQFAAGKVNRAAELLEFASGKGINFCRAALASGLTDAVLIQAVGGENGQRIEVALRQEKITADSIAAGPTRCCISCCQPGGVCTELIEPSTALTPEQSMQLLQALDRRLEYAGMAAFCGSLPDGSDPAFYRQAVTLTAVHDVPVLLDTVKDLPQLLERARRAVVKINRNELEKVTGTASVPDGLRQLFRYPALECAAITDGPDQAYVADRKCGWIFSCPELTEMIGPIGCGDTCGAVLCGGLLAGKALPEAFADALAAASANCLVPVYGNYRESDAARLRSQIAIKNFEVRSGGMS